MATVEDFATQLTAAGITADKPLHAILTTVHDAALAIQVQPVVDIERAVRVALMGLRPAFEHRWRWQRWASMIGVSAAGVCVASVLILASWTLSEAVTRREASAEAMRWQAWWIATCADKSPRRVVVDGKLVCQVPMDMAGK